MSRRALEESAVNLGQGFPDYSVDPRLSQALIETIAQGRNQYPPMQGAVDVAACAGVGRARPISMLADEGYEHVRYDGRRHASVLAHPELRARSFAVFSFGKTLHASGWRVGYCVAPPAMTRELRKVHQFNTFSIASPLQYAIARYLSRFPDAWMGLSGFFH